MAYAVEITISTGNKVSVNYQSHEASVSLTYQLEREDTDVLAIIQEKSVEVAAAHALAWQELRGAKKRDRSNGVPVTVPNGGKTPSKETAPDEQAESPCATSAQLSALRALLPTEWDEEALRQQLSIRYGHTQLEQLSTRQAAQWLLELQRRRRDEVQNRVQSQKPTNGSE